MEVWHRERAFALAHWAVLHYDHINGPLSTFFSCSLHSLTS